MLIKPKRITEKFNLRLCTARSVRIPSNNNVVLKWKAPENSKRSIVLREINVQFSLFYPLNLLYTQILNRDTTFENPRNRFTFRCDGFKLNKLPLFRKMFRLFKIAIFMAEKFYLYDRNISIFTII